MGNQIECLLKRVERIGIVESDSPGERIRKTVLNQGKRNRERGDRKHAVGA